ncbi:MAG: molecular chaperone HtpG [Prevotellaceae bacterium]|jgi:molecular chaperone HtpG|nr:molecular chaperone HtpG [Prevotellaceae bacterium]
MKGKIGVTTENIFPVIKKFLYSDHEIFLREIVSNAVDATKKLLALSALGEVKGEVGEPVIRISLDKKNGTLTVSDSGIGMTEEEIERFINQIAFSGAEEFLEKYKDKTNIIGHFGLGFYSSFMVADKVEIDTKSYKDAPAVRWECDGSPEYATRESGRTERGTDIILHIAKDSEEFLSEQKIKELLNKYCKFLPIPIVFGKEQEWKDGKYVDADKDLVVNNTNPLWTRTPSDLKEEDYMSFYAELYPAAENPLFYIHLNVDYPFHLTGVLYFPKIRSNIDLQRNKIQLYSNQVFVTDSVEGIVPDFLTLLHGVLDSPDIPLNVSRSYLQSDANVKKISGHISKKVSDRLAELFAADRPKLEGKWDDLKLFIEYGMVTDEKFYERAEKFYLLKNTDGKCFTFEEYKKLIEPSQTDKHKNLVYLYASDVQAQYTFIDAAKRKGYDVLLMGGQLNAHFISKLESAWKESRFVRVDADVVDKLIEKDVDRQSKLPEARAELVRAVFEANTPDGDASYFVSSESMDEHDAPVVITQNEFMRRMKDMSAVGGGGGYSLYGQAGEMLNVVVNTNHPLVLQIDSRLEKDLSASLTPLQGDIAQAQARLDELSAQAKGKKDDDTPQAQKDELAEAEKQLDDLKSRKKDMLAQYGKQNQLAKQLLDLALLANNRLTGEALDRFVKRSVELMNDND